MLSEISATNLHLSHRAIELLTRRFLLGLSPAGLAKQTHAGKTRDVDREEELSRLLGQKMIENKSHCVWHVSEGGRVKIEQKKERKNEHTEEGGFLRDCEGRKNLKGKERRSGV